MALGLSINGVVQPFSGLGNMVPWSSGQIPSMWMEAVGSNDTRRAAAQACASTVGVNDIIPRVGAPSAFAPANTCGIDGSMACTYGGPASALSGLGNVFPNYASFCSDLTAALDELQNIRDHAYDSLSEASKANLDATLQALGGFSVYVPLVGTDCQRHTAEARTALADLRAELGASAPPLRRPNVDAGGEPSGMPLLVKVAIGVGIGAVALGALGYSASSLSRLFRGR